MTEPAAYPVKRWIRLIDVDGRTQVGYAPLLEFDHLAAYAPFLHTTEKEAREDLAGDESARAEEIADGEREEDDLLDDFVLGCTVHEDGRIEFDEGGWDISRENVFSAYGIVDPLTAGPGPRT